VGGATAVEESSTGGDVVGDPPAHEEGSTEGCFVGDPLALDECSTGRDLVGGPLALSAGSTEGDRMGGPQVLADGLTDGGNCARLAAQTAVRHVRGDGFHTRFRAVHVRVGLQGRRGPHQVGGGQGGEDRDSGLKDEAGRNPNAVDRHASPMGGGRSEGGVGRSAAV